MALDPSTTTKMQDWYTDYMAKQKTANPFSTEGYAPATLTDQNTTQRTVNTGNETVAGQLTSLLDSGSSYVQQARNNAMQTANSRGLLNSTMAATAGEKAAIESALPIAQADAGTFKTVADYNTALKNETAKYNTDQANTLTQKSFDVNANLFGQQQKTEADRAAQFVDQQAKAALQTQQIEADKYKVDANIAADAAKSKTSLVNNILMTTDLSPDRKAELLKAMGSPELASAIYVVDSTAADLNPAASLGRNVGMPWYMQQAGGEGTGSSPT